VSVTTIATDVVVSPVEVALIVGPIGALAAGSVFIDSNGPALECSASECAGRLECSLCMEPVCSLHEDTDPQGYLDPHECVGGWGLVHRDCHATSGCALPECWL
jgi:hypothetical protein